MGWGHVFRLGMFAPSCRGAVATSSATFALDRSIRSVFSVGMGSCFCNFIQRAGNFVFARYAACTAILAPHAVFRPHHVWHLCLRLYDPIPKAQGLRGSSGLARRWFCVGPDSPAYRNQFDSWFGNYCGSLAWAFNLKLVSTTCWS